MRRPATPRPLRPLLARVRPVLRRVRRAAPVTDRVLGPGPASRRLLLLPEGMDAAAALGLAEQPGPATAWTVRSPAGLLTDRPAKEHDIVVVAARSVTELRRLLPLLARCGRASTVVVVVAATSRPDQVSVPSTLTGGRLERADVRVRDRGRAGVVVTLGLRAPSAVQAVVRSVVQGPRQGGGTLPAAGLRLGLTDLPSLDWAAGDPWARLVDAAALTVADGDIAPVDVVVGHEVRAHVTATDPPLAATTTAQQLTGDEPPEGWSPALVLPPVDTRSINPWGFDRSPSDVVGTTSGPAAGHRVQVVDTTGRAVVTLDPAAGIGEDDVRRLRPLRHLDLAVADAGGPVRWARLVSQLLVAGVPVRTASVPALSRSLLGDDLCDRVETLDAATTADPVRREAWSVGARREALLRFGSTTRWRATADRLGATSSPAPSMSVLLATKRPSNLRFALAQLQRQTWPDVEVVLALHGVPADDPDVVAALAAFTRPVQVLTVDAGVVFGEVLGRALQRASGRLVAKVDDDDWYGPDHLSDLVLAHAYSGATLVGLADHFTYLEASDLTIRDTVHASEAPASRVSGGTLALARDDLLAVGGWRPVHRAVDRCLIQAVGAASGLVYATHDLGFCLYRGSDDHTWAQGDEVFLARDPDRWDGLVLPPEVGTPLPR